MTHTHFIGIGGTGLSAIAKVLLERGETVSGSDRSPSPLSESVEMAGAKVYIGHKAEQVAGADLVVRSSAVPDDNVEVIAAKKAGIPVLKRIDYFKEFLKNKYTIGIAGSHGKTTTTSMIAWMLHILEQKPGFIVGGEVTNLKTNASAGESNLFVIEADEYDYMYWGLSPKIAIVTNVEHDHPDCFPTPADFEAAFHGYVDRIDPDGILIACLDDSGAADLLTYAQQKGIKTLSYSLDSANADFTTQNREARSGSGYQFSMYQGQDQLIKVELDVPGEHNVLNALAALITAKHLGLDLEKAAQALSKFEGAGRRFEILGEAQGVLVIDDYGHHPTEIRATLAGTKDRYPDRRLWAVWQPHTFSRTTELMEDFGKAFPHADKVVVTKVYAAREEQPPGFSPQQILNAIEHQEVCYKAELDQVAEYLIREVKHGDVVIVFSAGDAVEISQTLFKSLQLINTETK